MVAAKQTHHFNSLLAFLFVFLPACLSGHPSIRSSSANGFFSNPMKRKLFRKCRARLWVDGLYVQTCSGCGNVWAHWYCSATVFIHDKADVNHQNNVTLPFVQYLFWENSDAWGIGASHFNSCILFTVLSTGLSVCLTASLKAGLSVSVFVCLYACVILNWAVAYFSCQR